jgi:hypothetical protein
MSSEAPVKPAGTDGDEIPRWPYGSTEVRLSARQWLVALGILLAIAILVPALWGRLMRLESGPDTRIPYALSNDYWLYGQRLRREAAPDRIVLLGDSVVWGEYVAPDGTLSHFLNREAGASNRFFNAGVNGLFPLAMEGLVRHHGRVLRSRKVLVHCNLLWMASPKADLSINKETSFNHSRLVPQFVPRIPCYRAGQGRNADVSERLSAVIGRNVAFFSWARHLQDTCFDQKSILNWTLELERTVSADGSRTNAPNAYRNPLARLTLTVPRAPDPDPDRGTRSPRHKPWNADGAEPMSFAWVPLEESLQWGAFQRLVRLLRSRGNDVLVILGPFNEHMVAEENRPAYARLRDGAVAWLAEQQVPCVAPELLPSALYADASHPLTEGYELLARQIWRDAQSKKFCEPVTP